MMAARHPDFYGKAVAGVVQARQNAVADGAGGVTHAAWNHWVRLVTFSFGLSVKRVVDPMAPLAVKLSEVDLVDIYAWWLVNEVGVTPETAKGYVGVVNAAHDRAYGIGLAGGYPLTRVMSMLDGVARLQGAGGAQGSSLPSPLRSLHAASAHSCARPARGP